MADIKEYTEAEYREKMKSKLLSKKLSSPGFQYGVDTFEGEMRHSLRLPEHVAIVMTRGHVWDWVFADNAGVEKFMRLFPEFCHGNTQDEKIKLEEWRMKNRHLFNTYEKAIKYLEKGAYVTPRRKSR